MHVRQAWRVSCLQLVPKALRGATARSGAVTIAVDPEQTQAKGRHANRRRVPFVEWGEISEKQPVDSIALLVSHNLLETDA